MCGGGVAPSFWLKINAMTSFFLATTMISSLFQAQNCSFFLKPPNICCFFLGFFCILFFQGLSPMALRGWKGASRGIAQVVAFPLVFGCATRCAMRLLGIFDGRCRPWVRHSAFCIRIIMHWRHLIHCVVIRYAVSVGRVRQGADGYFKYCLQKLRFFN